MPTFDSAQFRRVLSHFPTGVTVITATGDNGPVGLTVGSFTSVSLEPPLVGFLPTKTSSSWPVMHRVGSFCVNILAEDQADLCWRFAKEGDDKFDGLAYDAAPTGSPIIHGVLGWIDCRIEEVIDAGDHWFVLGRVEALDATGPAGPLLFFRGALGGFADA